MAETMTLQGEHRTQLGSKHSEQLRRKGRVPAVLYGHKQDPVSVSLDLHDFTEALHHGHRLFDLEIGGKSETTLVKDLQYDHLGKTIIHVDLVRVNLSETVTVTVPIEIRGTAAGTHEGGIVDEVLDHLEIECRVSDIPETIPVSVKDLHVGGSIHAGDIELPGGMKLMTDPQALVFFCHEITAAPTAEEAEEEAPTEPERIGEEKEEAEGEAAE